MPSSRFPRKPVPIALALCALNWLLPGSGYIACRDYSRGITLFVLINLCFLVGVTLGGYVLDPVSWRPFTPEFNLVASLTYLSQAFHGGGWLIVRWLHAAAATDATAWMNIQSQAVKTYADLGVFHMVTAGGLNYFATMRLYDLLAGTPDHPEESAPASQAEASPESSQVEA